MSQVRGAFGLLYFTILRPVLLVIQYALRMRRAVLSTVACAAPPYFSIFSHKRRDFLRNVIEYNLCVLILYTTLPKIFLILLTIQHKIAINLRTLSSKVPVIFVRFK
jgi:hypothetical protein